MAKITIRKRLQAASEAFYYHSYYSGHMYRQASREGRDKGLRGNALAQFRNERISNPPAEYKANAIAKVHELTAERKQRWKVVSWLAAITWLASCIYLMLIAGRAPLLSIASFAFVVIGTFAAKIFLGGIFHILWGIADFLKLLVLALVGTIAPRKRSWRLERFILSVLFNLAVCIAEIISTFALASWVFYHASI